MMYVTMDGRDGTGGSSGSCAVCCCEPIIMRAGEMNSLQLNYAPWSLPLAQGGPGVVPFTELSIEADNSTCPTGLIDGFEPPNGPNQNVAAAISPAVTVIDLSALLQPVGNAFEVRALPLYGPLYGTLVDVAPMLDGHWEYTPANGFVGYDHFFYEIKDAQGRKAVRYVNITVGAPSTLDTNPPRLGLYIDPMKIKVDTVMQTVSMKLQLGPDAQQCQIFHVTVKQPARSCDDVYEHLSCFDVRVGKC